jgi:hypothetical protein
MGRSCMVSVLIDGGAVSNSNDDDVFRNREEYAPVASSNTVVAFEITSHRLRARYFGPLCKPLKNRVHANPKRHRQRIEVRLCLGSKLDANRHASTVVQSKRVTSARWRRLLNLQAQSELRVHAFRCDRFTVLRLIRSLILTIVMLILRPNGRNTSGKLRRNA